MALNILIVLITGTSLNGIGFETALAIAKRANLVTIMGYNADRLKLSEDAIKKEVPTANIRRVILNLSSLTAVRKAAEVVNADPEPLHLLAPKLLAAAMPGYTPRVVFVSSVAHAFGAGVDFATLEHPDPAKYRASLAYFQAKSANILAAIELQAFQGAQKGRKKGVKKGAKRASKRATVNDPNVHSVLRRQLNWDLVIFTNLVQKEESIAELQSMGFLGPDGRPSSEKFQGKTIPQAAATTVAAAFDPWLNDKAEAYLDDCAVATESVSPHSSDPANAEKLWVITEKIIGEKFTF
ncbi:Short-chain dehydrogenase/reductase family protein [Mycena venus]|uniref:Short-chain dehydrogenase/reductase family protein n=1 Tax=Mycena venus TaxID=2733690 RepID=A0A8H6YBY7_9AGAR|nr:Short-chain dehydrogenase/reductase family protein [Mycena venus]